MRKLITTQITSTQAMPIKRGTLEHLQFAYQEALTAIANTLIGGVSNSLDTFLLWGLVNTGSGSNFNISAGAVYFNGEVFLIDASNFTASGGQTAVLNFVETFYGINADPTTFSNGVPYNVHSIRKMAVSSGVSGTGICDFSNLVYSGSLLKNDQVASMPASLTIKFDQDRAIFYAAAPVDTAITFDFTKAIPGSVVRIKWTYASGRSLTINTPSGATVVRDSGNLSSVASATNIIYFLFCGKNSAGNNEVSYNLIQV